jgi:hypothetical protein
VLPEIALRRAYAKRKAPAVSAGLRSNAYRMVTGERDAFPRTCQTWTSTGEEHLEPSMLDVVVLRRVRSVMLRAPLDKVGGWRTEKPVDLCRLSPLAGLLKGSLRPVTIGPTRPCLWA